MMLHGVALCREVRLRGYIAFLYEQQLYCQLVDLWEKVVEDCYDKYKAQLCYDGHYLYSLCKMLI